MSKYFLIFYLLLMGCQASLSPIPTQSSSTYSVPPMTEKECTCPQGIVVAANQTCPSQEDGTVQEIRKLDELLGNQRSNTVAAIFYQSETVRIKQGLLSKLTCGERQQRDYLLTEITNDNPNNVRLGITYIESLYQFYDPQLESAYVTYHQRYAPTVIMRDSCSIGLSYHRSHSLYHPWRYDPWYSDQGIPWHTGSCYHSQFYWR